MKSWNSWLLSLGLAGWCLVFVGCGGGDVPDPDADANAAAGPAPDAGGGGAMPPGPVAQNEAPGPAGAPTAGALPGPPGEAAVSAKPPGGEAEKGAEAAKKDEEPAPVAEGSASAAQMLALGSRPLPPAEQPAAADGAAAPGGASVPGSASGPGPAGTDPALPGQSPGPAGQSEQEQMYNAQRAEMAKRQNESPPGDATSGTPGGGYGDGGAAPGGGGDNGPADFRNPYGAVNAFLAALKAKNPEKLAEATARRAATEAKSAKNQKLFSSILEQSLTEDDLTELANKLEGFQVVDHNVPKSSAQFAIILGKTSQSGDYLRRTITTRREKDGWKVLDIGGLGTIDRPSFNRPAGRRPGSR